MKRLFVFAVAAFAAVVVSLGANSAFAVHAGSGQLVCGQCHTMHNSQGDTTFVATPQAKLLRAGGCTTHELCLSCHSNGGSGDTTYTNDVGAAVRPPKVWNSSQTWTDASDFNTGIGAGGDFFRTGSVTGAGVVTLGTGDDSTNYSLGYGHSLGSATVNPPGSTGSAGVTCLTCTNCHDPHGTKSQPSSAGATNTNVFRMLRTMPVGAGATGGTSLGAGVTLNDAGASSVVSYVGAASQSAAGNIGQSLSGENPTAAGHVWPVYKSSTEHNVYGAGASATGTGDAGVSGWCSQCHDNWHEDIQAANNKSGSDWMRHPVDCDMNGSDNTDGCFGVSGSGVSIVDWGHYAAITSKQLPMQQATKPGAGNFGGGAGQTYSGDGSSDRVMCLSCHFAHGGPYYDALRFDYTSAVSAGSQNGKSVTSAKGCQQCHNRGGSYGS